ncbi:MAG TPA: cobalamin-dependent protein [bacterium]|nr:cobalamin-dependent protein [bacterium]
MDVDSDGIDALFEVANAAAGDALALLFELKPDLKVRFDARGLRLAKEDMAYHIRNFAAIAFAHDGNFLVDYLSWLRVLFDGFGFSNDMVTLSFRCAGQAAARYLSRKDAAVFEDVVQRAIFEYGRSEPASNRYLKEGLPESGMARSYLQALIEGRRDLAQAIVDAEVRKGTSIKALYLDLFQPTQRELGRLWHLKKISVAQEHFATAATQYIMSTLYPLLIARPRPNGKRMIAACAQGELHEIGLRMVADFFEADGWDTRFFGANLPVAALVQEVDRLKPDMIALSASMLTNVRWVASAVRAIKSDGKARSPVIVGGIPFNVSPDLWKDVGADASAGDCQTALETGDRLIGLDPFGGAV